MSFSLLSTVPGMRLSTRGPHRATRAPARVSKVVAGAVPAGRGPGRGRQERRPRVLRRAEVSAGSPAPLEVEEDQELAPPPYAPTEDGGGKGGWGDYSTVIPGVTGSGYRGAGIAGGEGGGAGSAAAPGGLLGDGLPLECEKEVVIVRHGQSTWNLEGRVQGSTDESVLTELGEAQARRIRDALSGMAFDCCFASPISRARRTAEIVWEGRDTPLVWDGNLKEANLLALQGMLNTDAAVQYPEEFRIWRTSPHEFQMGGVYPVVDLWPRARQAWEAVLHSPGKTVLVVTHKSILRAMLMVAMGLPPASFRMVDINNGGLTVVKVSREGEPTITGLNLTAHMHVDGIKY